MIKIVNLGNSRYNTCSCCSAHTSSSSMKDIDEIMGHKMADNMFELNFEGYNITTVVRLCDECLKELKDKINELWRDRNMCEKESEEYAEKIYGLEDSLCTNIQEQACAIGFRAGAGIVYNEAKEIIKGLLNALKNKNSDYTFALKNTHPVLQQAEQFLKKE